VFNNSHPRITTARTAHTARRLGAGALTIALAGGFSLAGAVSAQAAGTADSAPVATSSSQFLSGSLLGTNLDNVVMLQGAAASARPGDATDTEKDPFEVTALKSINIGDGTSIQGNLGQFLQLGAIGQYATANQNGTSMAWTGGVSPDGGLGIGKNVALPGGDATLDLDSLLGTGFASNIANLNLAISAVSARAISDGTNATGTYSIAGADLNLTSPAIANLTQKVDAALDSVTNRLATLDGKDGPLAADLNSTIQKLNPALNLLGANANVTATIDTGDLKSLVQNLLTAQYGGTGVSFNLETGVVTLNLEKLLGTDLSSLPAGSELLRPGIIDPVLMSVTTQVSTIADQVVDRVKASLNNATVTLHADLTQSVAQAPLVEKVCSTVQKVIQVPTQVLIQVPVVNGTVLPVSNGVPVLNGVPLVGNLLTGLGSTLTKVGSTLSYVTQSVTQLVNQTVDQVVCSNKSTALPPLTTSVTADITGTVGEFLQGAGVTAKATAQVLGVALPPIDLTVATSQIASDLNTRLFGSDSAITDLVTALNTGLVDPAVAGLTSDSSSVGAALSDLLSITVNNQSVDNGTFSETALEVKVLKSAGANLLGSRGLARNAASAPVAQLNVARASVGPNVTGDVGGVDTTPPTGDDPGSIGNPSGLGHAASAISRLATTGAGITALVAAVLALLAAGAYLVREGYRRNRSVVIR
jgi:hypothetical protein